jgi:dipeptidase E
LPRATTSLRRATTSLRRATTTLRRAATNPRRPEVSARTSSPARGLRLDRRSERLRPKAEIRSGRPQTPYAHAMTRPRRILAMGGGGFSMEAGNALLDDYALALTGVECPKVCFLPTASGDADHYIVRFYRAFPAGRCQPSHISLFRRDGGAADLASHLRQQDLVYVGGGSVISMLGTWSAHEIDRMLRDAWEGGVVMAGLSAGSLCWFDHAMTACHGAGPPVRGMGFLPFSNAVHYDAKPERRAAYQAAIADGLPPGFGTGDGAALHFVGTDLAEVVASRESARAYHVAPDGADVTETELATRFLGAPLRMEPALAA